MIDIEFLERLIQALDESGLDYLELERGGTHVRLSKTPPAPPVVMEGSNPTGPIPAPEQSATGEVGEPAPPEAAASNLVEITSPMVGTFYRAPAPDAPAYVDRGKQVSKGDVVCIIEAMKLMNELESEVEGRVVEVCVENAQPVEYGQVLFRVDPT